MTRPRGLKSNEELAKEKGHETIYMYNQGCRCNRCKKKKRDYSRARAIARKSGDRNGIVSAAKAQAHLRELWCSRDITRRDISKYSNVPPSTLSAVRSGQKTKLRERTERKILATTAEKIIAAKKGVSSAELELKKNEILKNLMSKASSLKIDKVILTIRDSSAIEDLLKAEAAKAGQQLSESELFERLIETAGVNEEFEEFNEIGGVIAKIDDWVDFRKLNWPQNQGEVQFMLELGK
jgi:predicted transcriptional regulator